MGRKISPCKDCEERVLGCHSTCEKYQEFNAYMEEQRKARYKAMQNTYRRPFNLSKRFNDLSRDNPFFKNHLK